MEGELAQKKREMANIIEQANAAYEARDQAQSQMASLKQQADREHLEFEREWKELGKLISNDRSMKDYMTSMVGGSKLAGGRAEPQGQMRRVSTERTRDVAKAPGYASDSQEQVSRLEEAFARIQAATGIDNLQDLVVSFVEAEDSNFALFSYNNSL